MLNSDANDAIVIKLTSRQLTPEVSERGEELRARIYADRVRELDVDFFGTDFGTIVQMIDVLRLALDEAHSVVVQPLGEKQLAVVGVETDMSRLEADSDARPIGADLV